MSIVLMAIGAERERCRSGIGFLVRPIVQGLAPRTKIMRAPFLSRMGSAPVTLDPELKLGRFRDFKPMT
jgi:hypothetical protein